VAFIQFIKHWNVGEHDFITQIQPIYGKRLFFYRGGKGFYDAGDLSAKDISAAQHEKAAKETFNIALEAARSGKYNLVICDEINNAVHDGLLHKSIFKKLIDERSPKTSLCFTGRNFPADLLTLTDIATDMTKIKHHYDDRFLANKGIDF
jgi:cob(I)alamin adenosyltransferase